MDVNNQKTYDDSKIYIADGVRICEPCLSGAGGTCHVPGCVMCRSTAPDHSIRESILLFGGIIQEEKIIPDNEEESLLDARARILSYLQKMSRAQLETVLTTACCVLWSEGSHMVVSRIVNRVWKETVRIHEMSHGGKDD